MLVGEKEGMKAATNESNFIYSPMSIRAALSLAALGAKRETLNQMLSFLGYDTIANLKAASARLVHVIKTSDSNHDSGPELSFVNGIWFDQSKFLMPEFLQVAASVYKAFTECVDFNQVRILFIYLFFLKKIIYFIINILYFNNNNKLLLPDI